MTVLCSAGYRKWVIGTNESYEEAALHCAQQLHLDEHSMKVVTNAFTELMSEIQAIKQVKALAVFATPTQHYPRLVTVVVHMPIGAGSEDESGALDAVTGASTRLTKSGGSYLRSTLYFVHAAQHESESLEPLVKERWSEELHEDPLALIIFRREELKI